MEPHLLYESPFTDFDSSGVSGVFPEADVRELLGVLREVDRRSAA